MLPRIFFNNEIFCFRYPNKFVNFYSKKKTGRKIGEFYFTRKPYYYPQKDRKKKR
jgi:ribosomal protein S19